MQVRMMNVRRRVDKRRRVGHVVMRQRRRRRVTRFVGVASFVSGTLRQGRRSARNHATADVTSTAVWLALATSPMVVMVTISASGVLANGNNENDDEKEESGGDGYH